MQKHPILSSKRRTVLFVVLLALIGMLQGWMFLRYGEVTCLQAFAVSFASILILALLGCAFWFVVDVIHVVQAEILLSLVVFSVWLGLCYSFSFLHLLILHLIVGLCGWVILLQWYGNVRLRRWKAERLLNEKLQAPLPDVIDRISVKNGTRIHVIPVREIRYVQACGDYVMLFTPSGEFLKEQTMRALETHLPSNFVRIHRSFIVNVEQIDRVELFAKETYHVYLKNGAMVKASVAGYKSLKEVLVM